MSFQISGQGTKEGVLRKVTELHPRPAEGPDKLPHGTDRAQVDTVKSLVAAEIAALDPKVNGVRVTVEATAMPNGRSIQVTIFPLEIHV